MVKEKYYVYSKAFKEINEIIKTFPRSEYRKISKSFIKFIEENMDNNYEYTVEHIDDFQNQEMLEETKIILAIMYRDYIASDEERKQIYEREKLEVLQEEKRIKEKYNTDNLFKEKNEKEEKDEISKNVQIIEYKQQNLLHKILNRIINFFRNK